MKNYWEIVGRDSFKEIFRIKVPYGYYTENGIKSLLMALTAKEGLACNEIVGAYAKRSSKLYNSLLEVHKDFTRPHYMCGSNPHFTARVVKCE